MRNQRRARVGSDDRLAVLGGPPAARRGRDNWPPVSRRAASRSVRKVLGRRFGQITITDVEDCLAELIGADLPAIACRSYEEAVKLALATVGRTEGVTRVLRTPTVSSHIKGGLEAVGLHGIALPADGTATHRVDTAGLVITPYDGQPDPEIACSFCRRGRRLIAEARSAWSTRWGSKHLVAWADLVVCSARRRTGGPEGGFILTTSQQRAAIIQAARSAPSEADTDALALAIALEAYEPNARRSRMRDVGAFLATDGADLPFRLPERFWDHGLAGGLPLRYDPDRWNISAERMADCLREKLGARVSAAGENTVIFGPELFFRESGAVQVARALRRMQALIRRVP